MAISYVTASCAIRRANRWCLFIFNDWIKGFDWQRYRFYGSEVKVAEILDCLISICNCCGGEGVVL